VLCKCLHLRFQADLNSFLGTTTLVIPAINGRMSPAVTTEPFMTGGQSANGPVAAHWNHWATTLASLAVGEAFFAMWFCVLPRWLGFRVETAGAARWRWLAAIPSVLGFAVALRCVWDFGWTGRGTPAPVAPPKRLVVVGFYRHVRNPMYVGFAAGSACWVVTSLGAADPGHWLPVSPPPRSLNASSPALPLSRSGPSFPE